MATLPKSLLWERVNSVGAEHVLLDDRVGLRARGTMVAAAPLPYTCRYSLATDASWATSVVEVTTEGAGWSRRVRLEREVGQWRIVTSEQGELDTTLPGTEMPELLDSAIDVDLGFSPLFNTLPVRRLGLRDKPVGTVMTLVMAWIQVPTLVVTPSEQTYTWLGEDRVLFESGVFRVELELDPAGYVVHYPGLARRR